MATLDMERLQQLSPEYLAEDTSEELLFVSIFFIVLQALVFIGYIASRLIHGKPNSSITWVLFVASYVSVLGVAITALFSVKVGGMGRHIEYHALTNPRVIRRYLQTRTAIEYLYMMAITFPKLMICALYLGVFIDRTIRRVTWGLVVVLILYFISGLVTITTLCIPFALNWNPGLEGRCGDRMATYQYITIPGIITDLAILVLPLSTVWRLHVGRAKKAGIFLTFLTGSLGIVVCIIRATEFFTVDFSSDPTSRGLTTVSLTVAEPSAYFICACLPGMRPLAVFLARKSGLVSIAKSTIKRKEGSGKSSEEEQEEIVLGVVQRPVQARVVSKGSEDRSGLLGEEEEWGTGSVEHELFGRPMGRMGR